MAQCIIFICCTYSNLQQQQQQQQQRYTANENLHTATFSFCLTRLLFGVIPGKDSFLRNLSIPAGFCILLHI